MNAMNSVTSKATKGRALIYLFGLDNVTLGDGRRATYRAGGEGCIYEE